ncbi:MAG: hypothetical protein R6U50_14990 [Desulfobacterales bacterium]
MAQNFKIDLQKQGSDILIKLKGDFDGSSALELCHVLEQHIEKNNQIIIHTSGLSEVYPFGLTIFSRRYSPKKRGSRLSFTGSHKTMLQV